MAQINIERFKKVDKLSNSVHNKVIGTFTVFEEKVNVIFK